jgi:glycosyltransferase involved in cell wall biosynthesis
MGQADSLKVLYSFPHPLGGPGINTTAWQQIHNALQLGASVTVCCTSVAVPLPDDAKVIETMRLGRQRIPHRAIGRRRAFAYHDWRVSRLLDKRSEDFDVVHCWPSSCLRTLAAARHRGVVSVRELPNAHTADTFRRSKAAADAVGVELPRGASHRFDAARLAVENAEFRSADFLLAPSEYVAASFLEEGFEPARILRHQYGFDPSRFPAPEPLRPDRPFTAAFVGRGEPPKGLHLALRAWVDSGAAAQGRFIVLGRIISDYAAAMSGLLNHPSVEALGFVSDVGRVLREVDVLVFPTVTEGSALVTYEAMASGVVPLVSTAAGAPVRDGADGLLHEPNDIATLTGQLQDLMKDVDLLARLRRGALSRRSELTWQHGTEMLLAAYSEAIRRRVQPQNPQ